MLNKTFIVLLLVITAQGIWAQTEHTALLEGSQAYHDGNFNTAIKHFQQAIDKNEGSLKGHYNLGNALYKDKQYESAITHFQQAAEKADNEQNKAQAFYNLGNSYLAQAQAQKAPNKESKDQLEAAIGAYKSALRNNPKDFEAKNNLATAYKLLRQQQPPQEQQNQDQQQENQDNQENQENQENQDQNSSDNQEQQNQQQDNQDQNQQNSQEEQPIDNTNEPQPKNASPQEMSKAEAKRLLQVVAEDDKDVQERLMQRQQQPPRKGDKTW